MPPITSWPRELLRIAPARPPIGHSIRAGLSVGGPFVIGVLTDHVLIGMWIGLATLLLAAGEREGSHRLNFTILLISTPIAASGYLLAFIADLPLPLLVLAMAVIAGAAGLLSTLGAAFSVGAMQFLLVGSIALGVTHIPSWWVPIGLYFVGAALYAALMLVEFALDRRRPERVTMTAVTTALHGVLLARLAELGSGASAAADLAAVNADVDVDAPQPTRLAHAALERALAKATTVLVTGRSHAAGRSAHWESFAAALEAAESVAALALGSTDAAAMQEAADALTQAGTTAPATSTAPTVLGARTQRYLQALTAIGHRGSAPASSATQPVTHAAERRERFAIGHDAWAAAGRLALCFGVAVAAKAYFPYSHWFWVPLTVALVMKPDFGSVFSRAVLRVIGTVLGALLATAVILLIPKGVGTAIAIGLLSAAVPWAMMRSYALQAVAIAPVVILLVDLIEPGDGSVNYSLQRVGATVVGSAIVLVLGYLVWPAARRADVGATVGRAATALAQSLQAAALPVTEGAARHTQLVTARRRTYATLADARTQLQRSLVEPPPGCHQAAAWITAIYAVEQLADDVTRYADRRLATGARQVDPAAASVADDIALLPAQAPEQVRRGAIAARARLALVPATQA